MPGTVRRSGGGVKQVAAKTPGPATASPHEFDETNGVTRMRITQVYDSKDARDGAIASGMDQGVEACFARMEEMLTQPVACVTAPSA